MPVSYMPVMLSHAPEECNSDAVWQTRHHPKLLQRVSGIARQRYFRKVANLCSLSRQLSKPGLVPSSRLPDLLPIFGGPSITWVATSFMSNGPMSQMSQMSIFLFFCLSLSSALDLPDLWQMAKTPINGVEKAKEFPNIAIEQPHLAMPMVQQPDAFMPTVRQIDKMRTVEQKDRKHWFFSAFLLLYVCITLLGTLIMTAGPTLKPCQGYKLLHRNIHAAGQGMLMAFMFWMSWLTISCTCFWAMISNRMSKTTGLDWELYLFLFCLVGVVLLVQALFAVIRLPEGKHFGLITFAEASSIALFPFFSDYFDTLKDVIFSMLCLKSEHAFINMIGEISFGYLAWIHGWFIFHRPNCSAELCATYTPLITAPFAEDTANSGDSNSSFFHDIILPLLYKQVTPTKRELLLWENIPQAIFSIIFLLIEGGSFFVSLINILLPTCQVVVAYSVFPFLRRAVGPGLGKKLRQAMEAEDYFKAHYICAEVPSPGLRFTFDLFGDLCQGVVIELRSCMVLFMEAGWY
eukprot:symbB.v1.2.038885.t3/scaffold6222.1/size19942/3